MLLYELKRNKIGFKKEIKSKHVNKVNMFLMERIRIDFGEISFSKLSLSMYFPKVSFLPQQGVREISFWLCLKCLSSDSFSFPLFYKVQYFMWCFGKLVNTAPASKSISYQYLMGFTHSQWMREITAVLSITTTSFLNKT